MFLSVSSQMDVPRDNHTQGCEENGIGSCIYMTKCIAMTTQRGKKMQKVHTSVNIHAHTYPQSQTHMYWS
jgi:hypothetical protein